jgi:hypothetical protein
MRRVARSGIGRSAVGIFCVIALCHCESVPEITFADPDAASDGSNSGKNDGGDGSVPVDGGSADASTDGAGLVCPSVPPPQGVDLCCDAVACQGTCTTGDCQKCTTQCAAPGLVCCTARKPLTCVPVGTACP